MISYEPYAVRLQLPKPFLKPYSLESWFSLLPYPKKWEINPRKEYKPYSLILHPTIHNYSKEIVWNKTTINESGYTSGVRYTQSKDDIEKFSSYSKISYSENTMKIPYIGAPEDWEDSIDIVDNKMCDELVSPRFTSFLNSRKLKLLGWDIFISGPNGWLRTHQDTTYECTKLNFVYCFDKSGLSQQNYYDENDKLIYEHNLSNDWTQPSLTNVGRMHNVINKSSGVRICLSYKIGLFKAEYYGDNYTHWKAIYPILSDLVLN